MDLNPTFGREELVETFSQNSGTNSRGSNHNNQSQQQQQHRRRTGETSSSSSDQHEQQQRNSSSNNNKSSSSSSTEHQRRLQRNARIQQQQRSAVLQQQQQNVDDAVRRLGYRLSIQAHGGDYHTATSSSGSGSHHYTASRSGDAYGYASSSTSHGAQGQLQLPPKPPFEHHPETSCFTEVAVVSTLVNDDTSARGAATNDQRNSNDNTSNSRLIEDTEGEAGTASLPVDAQPFRTMKVAKMNYHDQGDKQLAIVTGTSSKSILRKLTMECKDWFQHWEKKEIQRREQQRIIVQQQQQQLQQQQQASYYSQYPTSSTNNTAVTLSPQRFAFSQMAIAESTIDNTILPPLPILQQQQQQQQQLLAMNQQQQFLQQQQQLPHQSHHRASGVSGTLSELMSAAGQQSQHTTTTTGIIPKGLLSSVMEGHSDSATSASTNRQQLQQQLSSNNRNIIHNNFQEQTSQGSQSISTKDSRTLTSSYGHPTDALLASRSSKQVMAAPSSTTSSDMARMVEQQQHLLFPRGKCLTTPSEPASNNGHDNIDGNYIAYENDTITVSKKHIRIIRQNNSNKNDNAKSLTLSLDPNNVVDKSGNGNNKVRSATYRILSSAGQGTFAQVFQCLHVQTGKHVALKIVKNRPAYTRQAAIEIDIFQALQEQQREASPSATGTLKTTAKRDYMVNLISYFMHENHLCLVFELLGLNLYDVLKRRQFRGLPLTMVRDIIRQSVEGVLELSRKNIVHCDLKPENILFVSNDIITYSDEGNKLRRQQQEGRSKVASASPATGNKSNLPPIDGKPTSNLIPDDTIQSPITMPDCQIKLIDFGSACFEGHTAHSYIQSRFYRCPEVLLGLPYDTAIDMWSLGCVAAELFVGLPILPGVHEHDQLVRITEMISKVPDWMLDQGAKSTKYYMKYVSRSNIETNLTAQPNTPGSVARTPSPAMSQSIPQWRLKTQQEFIESLTTSEILKKGGIEKLQKQPGNRYFKRTKLSDILSLHGRSTTGPDKDLVPAFVHFLYGVLDPDPWRRLTAFQAVQHPFITGELHLLRSKTDDIELNPKEENHANLVLDTYWPFPWDPAICRRKLLNVQKIREKQQAARRTMSNRPHGSLKSQVMMANHRSSSSAQQPQMNRDDNSIPDQHQQPQNVEPPVIRSSSPPNQISSSDSTNASNQIVFATRDRPNSSAMNIQSQSGADVNYLQENVGATSSQPQSYQLTGRTPTHAELALALERPGVVPGTYGIGGLSSSQSTPASYNQNAATPTVHNQFGPYSAYSLPSSGYGSMNESFGSTEYNQMPNVPHLTSSTVLDSQRDARNNYLNTSGQNPSLSMMPGAMATHQPFVDAQQVALLQQQQHIMMMQQQQQQLTMLQSQQQMGMYSTPFQQQTQTIPLQAQAVQQTQFMMPPQQPMMMANAPNGGFYYVMTSPTGQPILLQPVGTLNQPDFHPQMGVNINPMDGQQHPLFMQQPTITVPQQQQQQQQPQMNPGGYFEQQNMPQMNYGFPQPQQQPQQPQQYSSRPSRNVSRHSRRGGTSM